MKQQLLLLQDVESLGKKGEIVTAKPGYVRNYLFPKGYAIVANRHTLRKQERLRAERAKQAVEDRKEAEELAIQLEGLTLEIHVKVDPEGHMYGSVSATDIAKLFLEKGHPIEKKNVLLTRPLKMTGMQNISLQLKEGVVVSCHLHVLAEGAEKTEEKIEKSPEESPPVTEAPQEIE